MMNQKSPDPDFVVAARKIAADLMPMLTKMAGEAHSRQCPKGIHPASFVMLVSASMHHQATEAMAAAANKPKDIAAMFMGMKAYSMMFDYMINFEAFETDLVEENKETRH